MDAKVELSLLHCINNSFDIHAKGITGYPLHGMNYFQSSNDEYKFL